MKKAKKPKGRVKVSTKLVRLLIAWVVEEHDSVSLHWLRLLWPRHDWDAEIALICRQMGRPLPFAKLLTFPGHAPTWSL